MSRFVRKIGVYTYKYQFDLIVHQVDIRVPQELQLKVVFTSGKNRKETTKDPVVSKNVIVGNFEDECLSMLQRIYKDKAKGTLQERPAKMQVQLQLGEKIKNAGYVQFNLSDFVPQLSQKDNDEQECKADKRMKFYLDKCPDKKAFVEVTIRSKMLSQHTGSEGTMSMMSDALSCDSGVESEYNFEDFDVSTNAFRKKNRRIIDPKILSTGKPPVNNSMFKPGQNLGALDAQSIITNAQQTSNASDSLKLPQLSLQQIIGTKSNTKPQQQQQDLQQQQAQSNRQIPPSHKIKMMNQVVKQPRFGVPFGKDDQIKEEENKELDQIDQSDRPATARKVIQKVKIQKMASAMDVQELSLQKSSSSKQVVTLKKGSINISKKSMSQVDSSGNNTMDASYAQQLQVALRQKEQFQTANTRLENDVSRIELEKESLKLTIRQNAEQLNKLTQQANQTSKEQQDNIKKLKKEKELLEQNSTQQKEILEQDKQKLQSDIDSIQKQLNDTQNRLRERETQVKLQEVEIEQSNEKIEKLLVNGDENNGQSSSVIESGLNKKIVQLQSTIDQLSKKIISKDSNIGDLQQKLQNEKGNHEKLSFEMEQKLHNLRQITEQLNQKTEDYKIIEEKLENEHKKSNQLKIQSSNEISELKRQIETIELDKKGVLKRIRDKDKKIQQLEVRAVDLEEEKLMQMQEHQEQIDSSKAILQHQLNDAKRRNQELEEKLSSGNHPNKSDLSDTIKQSSNGDDSNQQSLITQIEELKSKLRQQENDSQTALMRVKQENTKLLKELKTVTKIGSGNNVDDDTTSQMTIMTKNKSKNDRALAKLQVENEFLKKEIEEIKNKRDSVGHQVESAEGGQVESLRMQNNNLQEENHELQQELDQMRPIYQEMEANLIEAKMAWANLDMENDELALKLKKKTDQVRIYSLNITEVELKLAQAKEDYQQAVKQIDLLTGNTTDNTTAMETLQDDQKTGKKSKTDKLKSFFKLNKKTPSKAQGSNSQGNSLDMTLNKQDKSAQSGSNQDDKSNEHSNNQITTQNE